jgi:hypothetical protein
VIVFLQPGFRFPKGHEHALRLLLSIGWASKIRFLEGILFVELGEARNALEHRSSHGVFAARVWVSQGLAKATSMH